MYSKTYWITCNPGKADELLAWYENDVIPAVKASEHHIGHHMIQSGSDKWLLVSNYVDQNAAESAVPMVQELVKPMIERCGMTLEPITEGDVIHSY